jgi:hypothetical protein
MLNSFLLTIRFLILAFSGHKRVASENVALRHQLLVFTREKKRPRLRHRDRLFWIALRRLWEGLADGARFRSTGDGDRMATRKIQTLLAEIVSAERARTSADMLGDSQVDPNDGRRQSHMGSAAHPWRIAEAWIQGFGANGFAVDPEEG